MTIFYQYINIDPDSEDQRDRLGAEATGRVIKLVASINEQRKGVSVVFELQPAATNFRPSGGAGPLPVKKRRAKTDDQGKARAEFELTKYGGDEFTVEAYIPLPNKEKRTVLKRTYGVRRRFYYQLSRYDAGVYNGSPVSAIPALDLAPVKSALFDVGVELVDDSRQDLIPRGPEIITRGLQYPPLARQGYAEEREPLSLRIVLVNQIAEEKTNQILADVKNSQREELVVHPGDKLYRAADGSLPPNEDWIVSAEWSATGADPWTPLAKTAFSIGVAATDRFALKPNQLPGDGMIRVTYRVSAGETNGVSLSNAVFIAYCGQSQARVKAMQSTLVHEIGHFLGMVPKSQSSHYSGHGHKGPHCSTGLSNNALSLKSYEGKAGTCVMFGESGNARAVAFCALCDRSIRACKDQVPRNAIIW